MKKTIATLAILASANVVNAMPQMPDPSKPAPVPQKICLEVYKAADGSQYGGCNAAANNQRKENDKVILENGCTADQVSITHFGEVQIDSCLPPGYAQL